MSSPLPSVTLSEKLEGEFRYDDKLFTPGEKCTSKPLPRGKDAVGGGSGFPASVAVPATTPGEIKDLPERKKDAPVNQDKKKVAQDSKE